MSSHVFSLALRIMQREAFPGFRKWAWRGLYEGLSRFEPDKAWRFMNYGYAPPDTVAPFHLEAGDEAFRPYIGLYHQALEGLAVKGARVLEVGSGRGGGASYVARYFEPASIVAVDYSPQTVKRARRLNLESANLEYRVGDAEALAFEDGSFDIVINIESSHCYADMPRFVSEVARVLKPGGWFSWADMRAPSMIETLDRNFHHPELTLECEAQLNEGVVRALDMAHDFKYERIVKKPVVRDFLMEFSGVKGSMLYQGLGTGEVLYLSRRYRKTGHASST